MGTKRHAKSVIRKALLAWAKELSKPGADPRGYKLRSLLAGARNRVHEQLGTCDPTHLRSEARNYDHVWFTKGRILIDDNDVVSRLSAGTLVELAALEHHQAD